MDLQSFKDFWALVVEVWQRGFLGVDIGQIVIAIGIFLVFLILRRLFTRLVLSQIQFWAKRSDTRLDDTLVDALAPPIRFIPIVLAIFLITEFVDAREEAGTFLANLNRSLVAFTIFWGLFQIVDPVARSFERVRRIFTAAMVGWMVKIVKAAFVFLGAATILEIWGIEVGPILAGLGIVGVAVALGAQDLFKNLISGFFVIGERRFHDGDWIKVEGVVEGTVETIGLRTTKVRRFDKAPVYVPNSELADHAVTNFSQMTFRRIYWVIGVEYRTTKEQLRTIRDRIEAYLTDNGDFAQPPDVPLFVRIDGFNDSSIDIMVYCFTRTTVWGEWLAIKENLAMAVKSIVEEAGTAFAFPSQSLYLEKLPEGPEIFPLQPRALEAPNTEAGS